MSATGKATMFDLRWKENLVKHQKVSENYENDCRFVLLKIINNEVFNNFEETDKKRNNRNKLLMSLAPAIQSKKYVFILP